VTDAPPASDGAPVSAPIFYAWWNVVVPLLAAAALPLLVRVRVGAVSSEGLQRLVAGFPSVSQNLGTDKSSPYARLIRQSQLDEAPREIVFMRDEIVLGRGEFCDVVIPHESISREHVRIKKLKPGYVIFDLNSKNGTYVDGRPIVENLLREGMMVRIGDLEFVFRGPSQPAHA
jgi:hypothetical protein